MKGLLKIGAGISALTVAGIAHADDLLGNSASAAFENLSDTQSSMAPLVLGVVGFTVILGLAIKWTRKAG